jgi:hypothetical protein
MWVSPALEMLLFLTFIVEQGAAVYTRCSGARHDLCGISLLQVIIVGFNAYRMDGSSQESRYR